MIELQEVEPGKTQQTFGGDTLNAAIYMARLSRLFPARVDYVTALGHDIFSDKMVTFWVRQGVGLDELITIHGVTSIAAGHSYLAEKGIKESVIRCGAEPCSIRSGETSPQSPIKSLKSSDNFKSFNNC